MVYPVDDDSATGFFGYMFDPPQIPLWLLTGYALAGKAYRVSMSTPSEILPGEYFSFSLPDKLTFTWVDDVMSISKFVRTLSIELAN